jgi:hypothetical protein
MHEAMLMSSSGMVIINFLPLIHGIQVSKNEQVDPFIRESNGNASFAYFTRPHTSLPSADRSDKFQVTSTIHQMLTLPSTRFQHLHTQSPYPRSEVDCPNDPSVAKATQDKLRFLPMLAFKAQLAAPVSH